MWHVWVGVLIVDLELLVIGATTAGWQAAVMAAQAGINVGLVELPADADSKSDLRLLPGGLLRAACADWPLRRPLQRRLLDRSTGSQHWRQFTHQVTTAWQQEYRGQRDRLQSAGGSVWMGNARLLGSNAVDLHLVRGQTFRIRAEQIVLATGTRPQRPAFAGTAAHVAQAALLLEADSIPRAARIIGAGTTGLRAACLLAWWGSQVTVVEGQAAMPDMSDGELTEWQSWADELGVKFEFGEDAIGVDDSGARNKTVLTLESGRRVRGESVWLATGRRGETEGLQLDLAGVGTDERGRVWCDNTHRTWAAGVSAVGDVVGFTPSRLTDREVATSLVHTLRRTRDAARPLAEFRISSRLCVPGSNRPDPAHTFGHSAAGLRRPAYSRSTAAAGHNTPLAGW